MTLSHYTLQYNGLYQAQASDGRTMVIAKATVYKDGNIVDHIRPRRDIFMTTDPSTGQQVASTNMSIPGAYRSLEGDFYARIEHFDGNVVTFRVYWNPLINFVWLGGIVLILGTLVALWPSPEESRSARRVSLPSGASRVGAGGAD
jgi:cytochrome c-type biogenesis protein CcmF